MLLLTDGHAGNADFANRQSQVGRNRAERRIGGLRSLIAERRDILCGRSLLRSNEQGQQPHERNTAQSCPCSQKDSSTRWVVHCFDEWLESNVVYTCRPCATDDADLRQPGRAEPEAETRDL